MLQWGVKDPNEVLDYQIDWGKVGDSRLETGETLTSCIFTVVDGSVTIDSQTYLSSGLATVWLSGGTLNEPCTILNRVVTSGGRTYDLSARLRIRSK